MERQDSSGVIALLLVVIALAALAEVVAGRTASSPEVLRASSAEVVLGLGDAALARGDGPAARRAYLTGLFRARGERSLAGVVWAAEGFLALGDDAVVAEALAMAAPLAAAGGDAVARARLVALRERHAAASALPSAAR